jgi:glycosyltransferase involved in cell wall biosynthesis
MRILMINHEFTITGASTVFLRLATHLQAQGHQISLFPCNPDDGPIKSRYAERGIPVISNARLADFDLAIANTICAAAMVLKTGRQLRTIWFLHETEIGLNILLKNPELAAAFQLAAAVIYQTAFQQDVYKSFTYTLDPTKFHIIPNGVDIAPAQIARHKIPTKTRPLRVVQVGTIEPRKRPGDLIRAVALSGLDIECIICGKFFVLEDEANNIATAAPEQFRLLGETPEEETLAWVESADMFCLASGSESQPVSVFEAALLARPLILSDLPGYRGIFTHGRNCLMFPPGHIELLALTLRNFAASPNLRAGIGKAAQQTALQFTNAAFLTRFDTVIGTVTSTPGQSS